MCKCRNCSNYVYLNTENSPKHYEIPDCSLCSQINWTYWKLECLCGRCMVLIRWLCMSVVSLNISKFLKHSGCQCSNPFVHCFFFISLQEIYTYMPWIYPKAGVVYKGTAEVNIFQRGSRCIWLYADGYFFICRWLTKKGLKFSKWLVILLSKFQMSFFFFLLKGKSLHDCSRGHSRCVSPWNCRSFSWSKGKGW